MFFNIFWILFDVFWYFLDIFWIFLNIFWYFFSNEFFWEKIIVKIKRIISYRISTAATARPASLSRWARRRSGPTSVKRPTPWSQLRHRPSIHWRTPTTTHTPTHSPTPIRHRRHITTNQLPRPRRHTILRPTTHRPITRHIISQHPLHRPRFISTQLRPPRHPIIRRTIRQRPSQRTIRQRPSQRTIRQRPSQRTTRLIIHQSRHQLLNLVRIFWKSHFFSKKNFF